jgi:hypothetical protein
MEENCVRKGRNGRKLLRRLKPIVGCNANKRRRRVHTTLNLIYLNPCQRTTTLGRLVKALLKCLNVNQRENFLAVLNPIHMILTAPIT